MMFLGAMTVTNMFLGEVVVQMSPYIKEILKAQKLHYTKLYYQNQEEFERLCYGECFNEFALSKKKKAV